MSAQDDRGNDSPTLTLVPDEPASYRPGELAVEDAQSLGRLIALMREEIRTQLQIVNDKLDRALSRETDEIDDIKFRVQQLERRRKVARK